MSLAVKPIYQFGVFQLSVTDRQLKRGETSIPLTPKLFDLLIFLLENHGRAISKDELLSKIWPDSFVSEENLSRHISTLRKTLGEGGNGFRYIETLPKFGYRFAEPVTQITITIDQPQLPTTACIFNINQKITIDTNHNQPKSIVKLSEGAAAVKRSYSAGPE